MRMEIAAIVRANTYHGTTKTCLNITQKLLCKFTSFWNFRLIFFRPATNLVVRKFESHGMRALARAHKRMRTARYAGKSFF